VLGGAFSTAEAISLAVALRPDGVLADVHLGEEERVPVAVRLASKAPSAAMILISSHAEDDLAELVSASPAVGFLAKSDLSAEAVAALVANERRDR
jgi:DNA-binding NarL/FixJ family response regulator